MKSNASLSSAFAAALLALGGVSAVAQTATISSISITTGVVTVTPRIGTAGAHPAGNPAYVGNSLAGITFVSGNAPLTGDVGDLNTPNSPASDALFTLTAATYSSSTSTTSPTDFAFMGYGIDPAITAAAGTPVDTYGDVSAALYSYTSPPTAGTFSGSYSGLTWLTPPDSLSLPTANVFYTIHHRTVGVDPGDYFAVIVPATSGGSTVYDLKAMSSQSGGGPLTGGNAGYSALTYVSGSVGAGYAANSMYYLRNDISGNTFFGQMIPALGGGSADVLNLSAAIGSFGVFGAGNNAALAYSPVAVGGFAAGQFYYLRQDASVANGGTGNTILGVMNPSLTAGTRTISDIANLGGVFSSIAFVAPATGPAAAWGSNQFYVPGTLAATAQSISFAAIPDTHAGSSFAFTVSPSASSGLPITLTVAASSTGSATISPTGPSAGPFTVTPTGTGIVTLQATQSGGAFAMNFLQQSFNVVGAPTINSALTAAGTVNTVFVAYVVTATGSPTSFTASTLPTGLVFNTATGAITGTPTAAGTTVVALTATNSIGTSLPVNLTITVAPAAVAPIIISATSAPGTVNTVFVTYVIAATGSPTSYAAGTLPAGLLFNTATGAITGTPTVAGTTVVALTATNAAGTSSPVTLTITVAPAAVAPIIISATSAPGTVGTPFVTYVIAATGSPTSYATSPLPAGLVFNTATGAITGTPTAAGVTVVTLTATNASGTSSPLSLSITIASAAVAPIIISSTGVPGTAGTPFVTYVVAATGSPTSYTATGLPPGLTLNPLTGAITGTPTTPGIYQVTITATNSAGVGTATLTITVAPISVAPIITSAVSASGTAGKLFVTYGVAATGLPTLYAATGLPAGLTLNPLTGAITGTATTAGTYVVTITAANTTGVGTATLTITIAPESRLINLSGRAMSGTGNQTITLGFVASGNGKNLLLRGVGPTLGTLFGLPNALPQPVLTLIGPDGAVASNAFWGTNSISGQPDATLIASIEAQVGAFSLPAGSNDAAMFVTVNPGNYTATLTGANGTSGIGLAEIYDADTGAPTARLINVSVRANVGTGANVLVGGFVVGGGTSLETVLIRAVGPGLTATFGLPGTLATPVLTVYDASGKVIATDAGWGSAPVAGNSTIQAAVSTATAANMSTLGAFPLQTGSADSAMVVSLPPGAYTAQVNGAGGTTGIGLVEIYEMP